MCVLFNNFMILFVQPLDPIVLLAFVWGVAGLQKNKREQAKCTNDKIHEISECRNEQRLMYSPLFGLWLRRFGSGKLCNFTFFAISAGPTTNAKQKIKRKYFIISSDIKFEHNLSVQLGQRVCTKSIYPPNVLFICRPYCSNSMRLEYSCDVSCFMHNDARVLPLSMALWQHLCWFTAVAAPFCCANGRKWNGKRHDKKKEKKKQNKLKGKRDGENGTFPLAVIAFIFKVKCGARNERNVRQNIYVKHVTAPPFWYA